MPKLIPLSTIVLQRGKDAQRIEPKIGEPFEFTAEEVAELEKSATVDRPLFRKPVNETASDTEKDADPSQVAGKQTGKQGGRSRAAGGANDDL